MTNDTDIRLSFADIQYRQTGPDSMNNVLHKFGQDRFSILHMLGGEGVVFIDGKAYPLITNSLFIIGPSAIRCTSPKHSELYVRNKLFIQGSAFRTLFSAIGEDELTKLFTDSKSTFLRLDPHTSKLADTIFKEIDNVVSSDIPDKKLQVVIHTLRLFSVIRSVSSGVYSSSGAPFSSTAEKVIAYVDEHYTQAIQLDKLASDLHFTKGYLCHAFKESANLTIVEYINLRRIDYAKSLLRNSKDSIAEVAHQSGFESVPYFCRLFKDSTMQTPSEYRDLCI